MVLLAALAIMALKQMAARVWLDQPKVKGALMTKIWKLEEAKTHFSALVREAETAPQIITRHGKRAGVLLSPAAYDQLVGNNRSAFETFRDAPDFSDLPDLERHPRADPRELDL
jgi:prevent-host-death family protein